MGKVDSKLGMLQAESRLRHKKLYENPVIGHYTGPGNKRIEDGENFEVFKDIALGICNGLDAYEASIEEMLAVLGERGFLAMRPDGVIGKVFVVELSDVRDALVKRRWRQSKGG